MIKDLIALAALMLGAGSAYVLLGIAGLMLAIALAVLWALDHTGGDNE